MATKSRGVQQGPWTTFLWSCMDMDRLEVDSIVDLGLEATVVPIKEPDSTMDVGLDLGLFPEVDVAMDMGLDLGPFVELDSNNEQELSLGPFVELDCAADLGLALVLFIRLANFSGMKTALLEVAGEESIEW